MKKVFALVLAVSLVLALGMSAMAAGGMTGDEIETVNGNVLVSYMASDVIDVTVSWEEPTVTYEWSDTNLKWVIVSASTDDAVTFEVDNLSSKATATLAINGTPSYDNFVTGASIASGATLAATEDNEVVMSLTIANNITTSPVGAPQLQIPVTLTIANP